MARKAPEKHGRKGLALLHVAYMFSDEDKSLQWLERQRWPDCVYCPNCGSVKVKAGVPHKGMTHRCIGGTCLKYNDLIMHNGLNSGAREVKPC